MPSQTRDQERTTGHRGRTTVLIVSVVAFATGAVAMLLGYEEALGLMVLALLGVAGEAAAWVLRPSGDEESRGRSR